MSLKKFSRVLVANRGEIAIRIFRALNELDIRTIGVFAKEDKYSLFRSKADESYMLDPNKGPVEAYLDIDTIIKIAKEKKADAIHPGYGFLSENSKLVDACDAAGITFIGPSSKSMAAVGDKISAKKVAKICEVPTIPGVGTAIINVEDVLETAAKVGYPVILKASAGGGGRGMRVVKTPEEMPQTFKEASGEALKAFGDGSIFLEKYLKDPKHIEVQIMGDAHGNIVHLYDRDCSVQRRHQKIVEYAPAFSVDNETREKIFQSALKIARHVDYKNAGTFEFLVTGKEFYFIEANTRVQVEHTVTEMVTGYDIVQTQILVAQGYRLDSPEIGIMSQDTIPCYGYSIQSRVTTEDPANGFFPDTGRINVYRSGSGNGIRLDGGNAFTGALILPAYDSLLVKVISHSRTFKDAARKMARSLREMRVRGVCTNIPFLLNVVNHDVFLAGDCSTPFLENTPELFKFEERHDRGTKMLEYIGDIIVNGKKAPKEKFAPLRAPKFTANPAKTGAKDEFKRLGAKGFCDAIVKADKLYLTDTTMRDAHQSHFATRMRTADMIPVARAHNELLKDAFSAETWGGATFDVAYRFLKESPWWRLEQLTELMPNTLHQMLLRASNAVGYTSYPDNVIREFVRLSAEAGVDVFRIFDSLNWMENMKLPVEEALKTGKIVEAAICYTGDLLDPNEKKYTLDYYVKKAIEVEKMGAHIFAIKDMAGLMKPYAARELYSALKKEISIPLALHTHDSTGNGVASILMAAEAGVHMTDVALESMSGLTSQPSLNSVVEALANTKRDTGIDRDLANSISRYFEEVRKVYKEFEAEMISPNTEIYKYEIPGGQYSNLLAQVKDVGDGENFEHIKMLYKQANDLLGNIVKVTPSSKVVGDFAIFMHKNGLTADNILDAGKDLSYPDSVIDYFAGGIGQPDGGFPKELQAIVLKGKKAITCRPGEMLPDEDFDAIENLLKEKYDVNLLENKHAAISYALYPKVYEEFVQHRQLYYDVAHLPSHVFFHGMDIAEETEVEFEPGKSLLIRFIGMSEPLSNGTRVLTFEMNGSRRDVTIVDTTLAKTTVAKPKAEKGNPNHVGASIPGVVGQVFVKPGDPVKLHQPLLTIEAMKIETTVLASVAGTIEKVYATEGAAVEQGELLAEYLPVK
ncbi:MAG: pyruvate carboxylase [Defluviitaleaceae bacterium]|nr:pyruvate carboxylase [Defluviitaleaceae bacterium]